MIYFHIYKIRVTEQKHGIGHNTKIAFNKDLENISTEITEQTNIDESSHEEAILIL